MCEYLWHTGVGIREAIGALISEAIRADDGRHQRSSERPSELMMEAISAHQRGHQS
jgi:hypothetical protein